MEHREERTFDIRLHLAATFDESYEGDEDGFAWHERFERGLRDRLVAAVFDVLRADPSFRAVPAPRGRDPESAVDIDVKFVPGAAASNPRSP